MKLFDRVGRGIVLNEHGRLFYEYASGALQLMNDGQTAVKNVRNTVLGTVKIGAYAFTPLIHPFVKAFARKRPQVDFHFSEVHQQNSNVLMDMTDLVLAATKNEMYTMQSYFPVYRELLEEEFYAVVSPQIVRYPKEKSSVHLSELSSLPLVEITPPHYYQDWLFQDNDREHFRDIQGITFRIGYTTNDFYPRCPWWIRGWDLPCFHRSALNRRLR